jgi:hypothetical protein
MASDTDTSGGAAQGTYNDPNVIGNWNEQQLIRFIQDALRQDPPPLQPSAVTDELVVARKFTVQDEIAFAGTAQITVGAAGSASAPPANPVGYIRILDNQGQVQVIPYYKPA